MCVCVCACVRACVRGCVCVCVQPCAPYFFFFLSFFFFFFGGGGGEVSFTELIFIIASLYISYCDAVQRQRLVLFLTGIGR